MIIIGLVVIATVIKRPKRDRKHSFLIQNIEIWQKMKRQRDFFLIFGRLSRIKQQKYFLSWRCSKKTQTSEIRERKA